ncbi:MAG TPA: NAD(P)H-dependent glycerol-3-phosphate dehydrogenase [Verrucomicrobiae bacterium]|jgi:glycerol-3-phosphate dehydrogenase (NAD(P)+)|nr:NAD(P)H-dependent glycerol-3-phosphate dehydrogenase [Verrucomicrobiae bacterium]
MKVTVIGAGAWGTALANVLCQNRHETTLWGHDAAHLADMRAKGVNDVYLPGISLDASLRFEADLTRAVADAECLTLAAPSRFFREITRPLGAFSGLAVSVTKGIENETGLTMSGILAETMPRAAAAVLSGPTLAMEVARHIPAAIVAAHAQPEIARQVQLLFHRPTFRIYSSADVVGVEMGGALKNVVAVAAGIGDGLGLGDNAKAGLITRAIVEIRRLGVQCGANSETFSGLSGLGDLAVTCYSRLSRNRAFGERVGRGEKVEAILASTRTVAEGYFTARSAYHLSRRKNCQTPIIDETHAALYEGKDVRQAVHDLMNRELKTEEDPA